MFDEVEALLAAFYSNLVILKPTKASYSFQAAANALSEMLGRTEKEHDALRKKLFDLEKVAEEVQEYKNSAEASKNEAGRLEQQSSSDRQTISEYLADATEKQSAVSSVHTEATNLSSKVDDYREDFEKFQKRLDERNAEYDSGVTNLAALINDFDNQRQSAQELITQSEKMLKSATVAGLASHFYEIRENITGELWWARAAFYFGIILLLISAIPLAVMILWPVLAPLLEVYNPEWAIALKGYSPPTGETGWQYLGQVLARFIILVPAAWFVSFSAIRHSSLFRLREHYTYKYSMAVSVEGFKKQAKGYEDEIAALVLEQLAFNPADKLVPSKDIPEGKSPNLLRRLFVDKISKRLKDLDSDA